MGPAGKTTVTLGQPAVSWPGAGLGLGWDRGAAAPRRAGERITGMLPWSAELAGRMHEHVISSELLRGNPLGDPHDRPLRVYMPPGLPRLPGPRYPSVYVIQGYTGHVAMWRNRSAFRLPFPETADGCSPRRRAARVVVYVDAWTAYGGSQFVDSPGTGRYHTYLCDEVVPFVDSRYRTVPEAVPPRCPGQVKRRVRSHDHPNAAAGPVRRPGQPRRGRVLRALLPPRVAAKPCVAAGYDGDIEPWWNDFRSRHRLHQARRR